jgi:tRNA A37 threonylcarbamoyltransferase TsaD
MEETEWVIELKFEDVKRMFDPVVAKVLCLIRSQLNASKNCKAMFLVGGFSESKYLQARVMKEYGQKIKNISVPPNPMAAIVKGGELIIIAI